METGKILIVDDDSDMQIFLSNLLETSGFIPISTGNSKDGIQKALKERPELIILDVPMPEKGGIKMHHDIKHDDRLKNIPVIMISTLEEKILLQYQRSLHIFNDQEILEPEAFLRKPLEVDEFLAMVRKIVAKSKKNRRHPGEGNRT